MKKYLIILIGSMLFFLVLNNMANHKIKKVENHEDDSPYGYANQEFLMLRDPKTNQIPPHIRKLELKYAATLPKIEATVLYKGNSVKNAQALTWAERGPNNIGGRTRAIGIDVRTQNNITIIAGGASGGIWRSTDDGASWTEVSTPTQIPAVTCIVQDTRAGHEDTWYVGTGEYASTAFDDKGGTNRYLGSGIFKSTDNGQSWSLLASTQITHPEDATQSDFSFVNGIALDPSSGNIYAATYGGIKQSTDGGASWNTVLTDNSYYPIYSQVAVTTTGIVYATIGDNTLSSAGIYKSTDGTNFSHISSITLPTTYNRIVIAIAPSNQNIVYFFGDTPGSGQAGSNGDGLSLWKYDDSGGGSATDLSSNLPTVSGNVGGLNTQGSYNMFVTVKPDDPNFIIIGTTNIYRSTDGFATSNNTTWIGGYSPINDISSYTGQHPDEHALVFRPGSNVAAYAGSDGGISRTNDITATTFSNAVRSETVAWSFINSGYDVTQFYSVSLAPESGSNEIAGGAQDNGNLATSSTGLSSWTALQGGGDGQYDVVAPVSDNFIYTEIQNGDLYSLDRSNIYHGELTPLIKANQLFTNPFALDPNNNALLYYAGGNSTANSGIWRNTAINTGTFPNTRMDIPDFN